MTISSTTNRNDYTGNGSTATYAYGFRILAESDLFVTQTNTSGVSTTLTLNVDYTVTGVGASSGGNIVLTSNLASGYALTIRRVRPLKQLTDIRNQGTYFPEIHEDAFDNATMVDQQLQEQINRTLLLQETDTSSGPLDLPLASDRANTVLGFDSNGDPIPVAGTTDVVVSTYMETLLDDTTASEAQTTLGISTFIKTLLDDTDSATARATLQTPSATELLSNKKLQDSTTTIVDDGDNTKAIKFQVSGVTTGQTRTITALDSDMTLVGAATTQTLTNKTFNGIKRNVVVPAVSNYTVLSSDDTIAVNTSTCLTVTLPVATTNSGQIFQIIKTNSGFTALTITDGTFATVMHSQDEVLHLQSNGTTYLTLYRRVPSNWVSQSFTGSWITNTTYTGFIRRNGDSVDVKVRVALTGAPTSAALTIAIPATLPINTAKLPNTSTASLIGSSVEISAAGTQYTGGTVRYASSAFNIQNINSTIGLTTNVTQAVPNTFANGDFVDISFSYPVTDWVG